MSQVLPDDPTGSAEQPADADDGSAPERPVDLAAAPRAARPRVLVVVTGTGTEVGKTHVAAAVARALAARGVSVAARKPVQSADPGDAARSDAVVLGEATGEDPAAVCPPERSYPLAMAPPMAADALGLAPIRLAELAAHVSWPDGVGVGLVEGAGGVRSPLAHDGDVVDLARALRADVAVLVARPVLGVVNDVRLAASALAPLRVLVVLNRYDPDDPLHVANRRWLSEHEGLSVVTSVDELADHLATRAQPRRAGRPVS